MTKTKSFLDRYETYDPQTEGYGDSFQWRQSFFRRISPEEAARILAARDPYEVLGLAFGAKIPAIKKAYRDLMMKWHPDRNPDKENAHEMCQIINAAYSYLMGK